MSFPYDNPMHTTIGHPSFGGDAVRAFLFCTSPPRSHVSSAHHATVGRRMAPIVLRLQFHVKPGKVSYFATETCAVDRCCVIDTEGEPGY